MVADRPKPGGIAGPWIQVPHGRFALATAARNFYSKPDDRIALTGITGTNGKTTSTMLIDSILRAAGKTTALIGTIEYHLAGRVLPAVNTTPESLDLFRMFHDLEQAGGTHATLEASSHALDLGPHLQHAVPYCRMDELHARSSRLPSHDGSVFRGEAIAVSAARGSAAEIRGR